MNSDSLPALIFKNNIIKRLEGFRAYSHDIESKFEKDIEKISERFNLFSAEEEQHGTIAIRIIMSEEYRNINDVFVGTYRNSTLVTIYSFLENTMRSICVILQKFNDYPIEVADLTGDGIQKSKTYLEKMAKIDFSKINSTWSNLQNLNLIRNCIVHVEGDAKNFKSTDKLKNIISNNQYLSLERDRLIVVEREYIDFVINEVENFVNFLFLKAFDC